MDNTQERLARIETLIESLTKKVCEFAERSDERHDRIARIVWGSDGAPGVIVRLDRLEQAAERSRWAVRLLIGAVVTLVAGSVWAAL